MRVLAACEFSGIVRDAFAALGHEAWSCDLLPSERPGQHLQCDVRKIIGPSWHWDLVVAFPPCTDLSVIGAKEWKRKQADGRQSAALEFVQFLMDAPARRIALENLVGRISTAIRKPDQIVHPYQFGDPWMKRTCLWLTNLPPLVPTDIVEPRGHWVDGGSRVAHKTRAFGDSRFGSGTDAARKVERSRTFPGLAAAMAEQWGAAS